LEEGGLGLKFMRFPENALHLIFSTDSICYSVGFYQSLTYIHHLFDTFVI